MTVVSRLFDADGTDDVVKLDDTVVPRLTDRQLLWVDVHDPDLEELRTVAQILGIERQSVHNLLNPIGRPRLDVMGEYFEVNVFAIDEDDEPLELDFFAGPNWVATVHREAVPFLDEFRERLGPDTEIGRLTAPSFLAAMLDWHVGTYFGAVDDLEREVDVLDERALKHSSDDVLRDMMLMRRRISAIRRILTPHREVYAALARPDFEVLASSESAAYFRALVDRMERAIGAVENARELLIGSFDIFMTRTGQRTNDVMRILTIISVILLPAAVIAGVMGMNFQVGLFESPELFWVVIASMVVIAAVVLFVAHRKGWL